MVSMVILIFLVSVCVHACVRCVYVMIPDSLTSVIPMDWMHTNNAQYFTPIA